MTTYSSPVPARSRLTSPFGVRWGTLHAGTDYGPPTPGRKVSVYAAADGVVSRTGRGDGGPGAAVVPWHSGHGIWIDHGTIGGDRMRSYYGHLDKIIVRVGQRVRAGEQIGVMGGSGARTMSDFAVHLHFGVAQNHDRPVAAARSLGAPGWIDADRWLRSKGVRVGQDSPVTPAAASGGSSAGGSKASTDHAVPNSTLTNRLDIAGYPRQRWLRDRVKRYQESQLHPSGRAALVADGRWGPVTEAHYQWTLRLQRALNQWRGSDIPVDGDCRRVTINRVREVQQRNHGGAYTGRVDGVPGPVTCRMLGIPNHPSV
ncbi:M23 family metallopeptidase [Nesterenkonia sp. CL21]|uniref:M23 family metallopeptidase n=1 Tax=Nesterenkonia sp. CL21 TaxID=3064894 RepID=UPI00287B1FE0|nr:M23 family metallopeptidase [Nesterenkonia sp. CL21]MDS2172534.1 M23 family metallopeptidase [Nesterenkonia sp. CL21]